MEALELADKGMAGMAFFLALVIYELIRHRLPGSKSQAESTSLLTGHTKTLEAAGELKAAAEELAAAATATAEAGRRVADLHAHLLTTEAGEVSRTPCRRDCRALPALAELAELVSGED